MKSVFFLYVLPNLNPNCKDTFKINSTEMECEHKYIIFILEWGLLLQDSMAVWLSPKQSLYKAAKVSL